MKKAMSINLHKFKFHVKFLRKKWIKGRFRPLCQVLEEEMDQRKVLALMRKKWIKLPSSARPCP